MDIGGPLCAVRATECAQNSQSFRQPRVKLTYIPYVNLCNAFLPLNDETDA